MSQPIHLNNIINQKISVSGIITDFQHCPNYSVCDIQYGESEAEHLTFETNIEQSLKLEKGKRIYIVAHVVLEEIAPIQKTPFDTPSAAKYGIKFVADTVEEY